jgi:hypothetical protein
MNQKKKETSDEPLRGPNTQNAMRWTAGWTGVITTVIIVSGCASSRCLERALHIDFW